MGTNCAPSSRRHLSVFIRSGFHTIFALNGKETVSISVQSHLQVHRWCIVHKQPRIRKLSGTDVSIWTWDQRHQESTISASYLDLLLSIGRDGQPHTSIYDKRDDFNFHITNFPFLSSNIPSSPAYCVFISQLIRYAGLVPRMNVLFWGPGDFPVSYSNRDTSWNVWNRHSGSFMIDTGILYSNMKFPSHEC